MKDNPATLEKSVSTAPRGAAVVDAVMRATFEALAEVGFAGLSIDEVAKRANVNKTTVYRRWPTKDDLVASAIAALPAEFFILPDTGNVRTDLIELGCRMSRLAQSTEGRAMLRMLLFDDRAPGLCMVQAQLKNKHDTHGLPVVVHRAIARGELPLGFDLVLLRELLFSCLSFKSLKEKHAMSATYVAHVVDVILRGLLPPSLSAETVVKVRTPKAHASATSVNAVPTGVLAAKRVSRKKRVV